MNKREEDALDVLQTSVIDTMERIFDVILADKRLFFSKSANDPFQSTT